MKTLKQKCNACGHVGTEFLQPATVDCLAIVDYHGDFLDWKETNFENPNFEDTVFLCKKCTSNELEDVEDDE